MVAEIQTVPSMKIKDFPSALQKRSVNVHLQGKTGWLTFLSIPARFHTLFWHGDAAGQGLSERSHVASQGVSEDKLSCPVLLTTG